jgi:hypothetical protein
MFVYIENVSGVSIYRHAFQYNGKSIEELENSIYKFLNIVNKTKIRCEIYSARLGSLPRKRLSSLNIPQDEVYIMLKGVE